MRYGIAQYEFKKSPLFFRISHRLLLQPHHFLHKGISAFYYCTRYATTTGRFSRPKNYFSLTPVRSKTY